MRRCTEKQITYLMLPRAFRSIRRCAFLFIVNFSFCACKRSFRGLVGSLALVCLLLPPIEKIFFINHPFWAFVTVSLLFAVGTWFL